MHDQYVIESCDSVVGTRCTYNCHVDHGVVSRKLDGLCIGCLIVYNWSIDEDGCRQVGRDVFFKVGLDGRCALASKEGIGRVRWK